MEKNIKNYIAGTAACLVLIFLTYASNFYNPKKITKRVTLTSNPKYDYRVSKGTDYWINMSFDEIRNQLEIRGNDYVYLEHPRFLREIKKDSVVTITYSNNFIEQLSKDGHNYMDPVASEYHGRQNTKFATIIFIAAMFTCLIPLLLRPVMSEDTFSLITKHFALILVTVLIITGLITSVFIDTKFIDADWTKYPVEHRRTPI